MTLTNDPNDPKLREIQANGQQAAYLVLSDEERAKGFVRPVRTQYKHAVCGGLTRMAEGLAETYARDPQFYSGTYCVVCRTHFDLVKDGEPQFHWQPDGSAVGS